MISSGVPSRLTSSILYFLDDHFFHNIAVAHIAYSAQIVCHLAEYGMYPIQMRLRTVADKN